MPKILVVEDEKDIRDLIEQVLVMEGYEVITAVNGKVGIEQAKNLLPDLIICDVNMPEVDGFGVIESLRNNKSTSTIPFIFLTARAEKKDIREGMNLGADDYLNKPFTIDELKQAIETRLARTKVINDAAQAKLEELRSSISMSLPHELKTPLNGIIGFAEALANDINSLNKHEIVDMAKMLLVDAYRLDNTIEKYLLFAHLQFLNNNKEILVQIKQAGTQINANKIRNLIDNKISGLNRQRDLKLQIEDAHLKMHEDYLKVVIEQLGNNCFDYSEKGTPIEITGKRNNGTYELTFGDKGRGMTEKQISEIGGFMQFNRNIYEQQGTGMGLIISKQIVKIFNGSFRIESELSKGTMVQISLPSF